MLVGPSEIEKGREKAKKALLLLRFDKISVGNAGNSAEGQILTDNQLQISTENHRRLLVVPSGPSPDPKHPFRRSLIFEGYRYYLRLLFQTPPRTTCKSSVETVFLLVELSFSLRRFFLEIT